MFNSQLSKNAASEEETFIFPNEINNQAPLIMVVEDDSDNRLMLKLMLEMWKYRVLEATDGIEALEKAQQSNLDLILMDVGLPGMDGFEVTRRLREFEALTNVPIIFLSGYASSQAEDVGATDYLVKPIDAKKLENVLSNYIEKQQMQMTPIVS